MGMAEAESCRRCRSSMVGRGGRGRVGINAGETPALPGGSRPHALPYRAAQCSCEIAPGRPACGSGSGMAEAESWRRRRSSMVGGGGRGRVGISAGETPALPGGSRPHALPYRAAQCFCEIAPGRPACGSGGGMAEAESWRRRRSSMVGRGGRGCVGINAGETPALPGGSRPHALPYRAAQCSCEIAPGRPACGSGSGMAEAESWRRCRSSMVGRGGRGRAGINAGETPALPGRLRPMTSEPQRRSIGLCVYSCFAFNNDRQFLPRMNCPAGQGRGPAHQKTTKVRTHPTARARRLSRAGSRWSLWACLEISS